MKSNFRTLLLIGFGSLVPLLVRADFITLKSGEKIEGRILSENADSLQVEYHLTAKIKDVKTVLKSAVAEIVRQTPSEIEFNERELQKILPTADLMTAREYESIIQDRLRTFVAKYPNTPESKEVENMIAVLADEKGKVLSGQLKLEGKWIDAATAKRDSYNIGASRLRYQMNTKAASRDDLRYLFALRDFEKLRTEFGASPHFVQAIPEALAILKKFETELNGMITEAPILLQKRQNGLKTLVGNDLTVTTDSIAKEDAKFKAAIVLQTKDKVKWMDIYKYDVKSLQDTMESITKERAELQSIDLAGLQLENEALMAMIRYIADGNLAEAKVILGRVNQLPNLINKNIVQNLAKQIDNVEKMALIEQKTAVKAANATPPTAESNDKAGSNPVAEAMKKVQEEKEKEAAEKAKKDAAAAKAATPKPASVQQESPGIVATLMDNLPLVGGVLAAVLGLFWFFTKKKA